MMSQSKYRRQPASTGIKKSESIKDNSSLQEPLKKAPLSKKLAISEFIDNCDTILLKEPAAMEVLHEIVKHVAGTYADKYQGEAASIVDTKHLLTKTDGGKHANMHSALKYLQRYISVGFEKSANPQDLKKCIHYLIFELTRLKNVEGAVNPNDYDKKSDHTS